MSLDFLVIKWRFTRDGFTYICQRRTLLILSSLVLIPCSYHTNTGSVVIQKGSSPNATTRLPLGDPLHNYAIALGIQILDSLGASTLEIHVAMVCFILKRFVYYFGWHTFDLNF